MIDLARLKLWNEQTARAQSAGIVEPPFVPVSRLVTRFLETLEQKVAATVNLLPPETRDRLARVLPSLVAAIQAEDEYVVKMTNLLLPQPPDAIAFCLHLGIDSIEQRFAQ